MTDTTADSRSEEYVAKMRAADLPAEAIESFVFHLRRYLDGETGTLGRDEIAPLSSLPDAEGFSALAKAGSAAYDRVAVIKLNGGLGTGMGLDRAKSLLEVRPGVSFLELIARQVEALRRETGTAIPLLLMNSFRTQQDSVRVLERYPDLPIEDLPLGFLQHRIPKILVDGQVPATHPPDPELEWCPPGHGDVFTALKTSGVLRRLLDAGLDYAFVSNADNLGAVLEPSLLGYMMEHGLEFMMEAADRTAADRKGGHLSRLSDGRVALRESAQCPPDEQQEFQDIELFRYFNTNNLWVDLRALERLLTAHRGVLPLHTIVNHKTLDPREPSSPPVVQLETAMGAAVSLFDRSAAVRVPRDRFSPVKNTDDLLAVRSDAYRLTDDARVALVAERERPPVVSLDRRFYRMIDDFEARFPAGPPSLRRCESLTVVGDVRFEANVIAIGDVRVETTENPGFVAAGTTLSGVREL
jgi:UTP--glucose-1-phosphate uridylyltransferase